MWQDYVISVVQWVFIIALIPSLLHREEKPPFVSSSLTALLALLLGATYISLDLRVSAVAVSMLGIAWAVLAYQRMRINREKGLPVIETPSFPKRKP